MEITPLVEHENRVFEKFSRSILHEAEELFLLASQKLPREYPSQCPVAVWKAPCFILSTLIDGLPENNVEKMTDEGWMKDGAMTKKEVLKITHDHMIFVSFKWR